MKFRYPLAGLCIGLALLMLQAGIFPSIATDRHPAPGPRISAEQAQQLASKAERAARAEGQAVVISVVDEHGHLVHLQRMDGTASEHIRAAQLKAATSARFPLSSREAAEPAPRSPAHAYGSLPGVTLLEGGLPILDADGTAIGGLGISGASAELDARFARAALEES